MTLRLGEIILIRMRFHQGPGAKVRPAVVLLDTGDDDFVGAPVTSQPRHSQFDLPIAEWRNAGLNVPSTIRADKLSVLAKAEIIRSLGILPEPDMAVLAGLLCRTFCPKTPVPASDQ